MSFAHASLALLSINLFLLIIAIYWTATSWQQLRRFRDLPPWHAATCALLSTSVTSRNRMFRNEFQVTNFTREQWPQPISPTIAYRYGSPVYNQTFELAEAFQSRFIGETTARCWVFPFDSALSPPYPARMAYTVSMTPVTNSPTKSQNETAIVSSVFTAITAMFLVILLCAVGCLSTQLDQSLQDFNLPSPPSPIIDSLSEAEINLLCKNTSFAASASVDACAICLEDEIKINAQLPCGHCFHRRCITSWLKRGNYKCPLCNLALTRDLIHCPAHNARRATSSDSPQQSPAPAIIAQLIPASAAAPQPAVPQPAAQPQLSSVASRSASSATATMQQRIVPPQQTGAT